MATILVLLVLFSIATIPVFIIGRRRGQKNPWAAFIPLLGVWIVLFESIGRSGWFALLVFVPYLGPLALLIWIAVQIPARHGRSRWWTVPLIVPLLNVVAYWFYALTLQRRTEAFA